VYDAAPSCVASGEWKWQAPAIGLASADPEKGRDLLESASELIRERPLASFGVAFATGWVIAKLARSGDK
jgi:hypothetical protein